MILNWVICVLLTGITNINKKVKIPGDKEMGWIEALEEWEERVREAKNAAEEVPITPAIGPKY